MPPGLKTFLLITGMLITGTINTISKKIQLDCYAPGYYNYSANNTQIMHKFNKPWFQTWNMFMGEALCLIVFFALRRRARSSLSSTSQFSEITSCDEDDSPLQQSSLLVSRVISILFLAPALFDITGSTLQGIGLMFIDASVWQMIRGSLIIFAGILSMVFLKRRLRLFHWTGMLLTCAGLCLVGLSSVLKTSGSSSGLKSLIGVGLVLAGSLCTAGQVIVEEIVLKHKGFHPLHVVGMEGIYGTVIMGCIVLPAVHFIPGSDLNGSYENFLDAIYMCCQNWLLLVNVLLTISSIAFFNYFGLAITQHLSAVHRTLIDALRTILVWGTGLVIYYAVDKRYGEPFDKTYGILQIDGFGLLLFGTFVYNKVITFSWIPHCEHLMSTDDVSVPDGEDLFVTYNVDDEDSAVNTSERSPLLKPA